MNTPICDFIRDYAASGILRLHMPGHKGMGPLGCEAFDITEVSGADDLSAPEGVIAESEENATALFGSRHTFYSTEGSSQCIKAMLYLALLHRPAKASRRILAGRNAHKAFLQGCGLLDLEPVWLWPGQEDSLCAGEISPQKLQEALCRETEPPIGVYITAPDYLGGSPDIGALAEVCKKAGVPLLVDNAHGAYLRFLKKGETGPLQDWRHPLELGAAMCADSAHKTLPVLTGGAYLHIGQAAPSAYEKEARQALSLFGSSSPSYLILASLDACCRALAEELPGQLWQAAEETEALRQRLLATGIPVRRGEPLKLVVDGAKAGTTGEALAERLRQAGIEPEFADQDFLVLMLSAGTKPEAFRQIAAAFDGFVPGSPRPYMPLPEPGERVMSPREALLSFQEQIPVEQAVGRVCAGITVSCPPAVPIALPGERITGSAAELLRLYGKTEIPVVLA